MFFKRKKKEKSLLEGFEGRLIERLYKEKHELLLENIQLNNELRAYEYLKEDMKKAGNLYLDRGARPTS